MTLSHNYVKSEKNIRKSLSAGATQELTNQVEDYSELKIDFFLIFYFCLHHNIFIIVMYDLFLYFIALGENTHTFIKTNKTTQMRREINPDMLNLCGFI